MFLRLPKNLTILYLYIAKRVLQPFALLLSVLLLALVMERMLRLVQMVTNNGAPIQTVLELVIYLLPHYLGLAIPAALFLAVMLGFRNLLDNSELVIMRNIGIPVSALTVPTLIITFVLTIVMLIITGYLQPHSRHAYRATAHQLATQDVLTNIKPGIFQDIGNGTIIRADQVLSGGKVLQGFFASKIEPDGTRTVFTARHAEIRPAETPENAESGKSGQYDMVLFLTDGILMQDRMGRAASELNFKQYPWNISLEDTLKPYGPRGKDEREMTLGELASGKIKNKSATASTDEMVTELNARIVQSLSLMILSVLAVPLALIGRGRSGKAYGIAIGVVIVVLYEKIIGFGEAFAETGAGSPIFALWGPFVILGLLALLLFEKFSGDKDAPLLTRLMRRLQNTAGGTP